MIKEEDLQIVTLEDVKANSRIDTSEEDGVILAKCKAAEVAVLRYLNTTLEDIVEEFGEVPAPIVEGVKIVVEELLKHRGATSSVPTHTVQMNVGFLIESYRKL